MAETTEQIKVREEYHQKMPRRWPRLIGFILLALILAAVIVFGARAIYRSHHHKPQTKTPAITKIAPKVVTGAGASSASGTSASSSSNPSSSAGSSSNNLPNNGPGQVGLLFAGSSLAAASLHFFISRRRNSQTN